MLNRNSTTVGRVIIVLLIGAVIYTMFKYESSPSRETVKLSFTGCISSICVQQASGENCVIIPASVSEVLVVEDLHDKRLKNIKVAPSNDLCN